MTKQDFIDKLYEIGWTAPCDAQHSKISELLDTIPHFAIERDLVGTEVDITIIPFDGEEMPEGLEVLGNVTRYDGNIIDVEATMTIKGRPVICLNRDTAGTGQMEDYVIQRDGNQWAATSKKFIDLQQSDNVEFSGTPLGALEGLIRREGELDEG